MKQNRNGYKLSKFVQKIFADLFVYSGAVFELSSPCAPERQKNFSQAVVLPPPPPFTK